MYLIVPRVACVATTGSEEQIMNHLQPRLLRVCVLLFALSAAIVSAGAAEVPPITLQKTDVPLSQVLSDISTQAGVQILIPQSADLSATLDLDLVDVDIEAALREIASQANCSWVRAYLLEPIEGGAEEYTFSSLLQLIRKTHAGYVERMEPEEREAFEQMAREAVASSRSEEAHSGPGFHLAKTGDMDDAQSDIDATVGRFMTDPLHFAALPPHIDPASVTLTDGDVTAFTDALLESTGFVVLDRLQGAAGTVSLEFTDTLVDEIVAAAADQLNCRHRRIYLLAVVDQLSEAQVKARMDAFFQAGVGFFWSQSPERRAELVRTVVERAGTLSADDRRQIKQSDIAKQVMTRFVEYCNSLPMEQRREMLPLLQEAAKLMGR